MIGLFPVAATGAGLALVAGTTYVDAKAGATIVLLFLCVSLLIAFGRRSIHFLGKDEQLRVQHFTEARVHNGPRMVFLNPFGYRSTTVRVAESFSQLDYARVLDIATGIERIECGPQLLFLGAYEKVAKKGQGMSLSNTEYVLIKDQLNGNKKVTEGPGVWFPGVNDDGTKGNGISLSNTDYIIVEDRLTGEQTTLKGPRVWFPGPNNHPNVTVKKAVTLTDEEYILIKDSASGERWVQKGKSLVFLEPTWKIEGATSSQTGVKKAMVLKVNEYVRLSDTVTGKVVTHRGEMTLFPSANDEILDGGKKQAVEVDEEHAALVRNKGTGQLRLVCEKQLFIPEPNETIEEVRELIRLADHEAIIIRDGHGIFHYHYGSEERRSKEKCRSFFLPPNSEIVKMWWSRGPRRERKDVSFDRFDLRPHFMKFEFNCRTADNVELVLEGIFFWEIIDLPKMVQMTGDTSGDLVYHVRSQFILHVARVTLKGFMEDVHLIAKKVMQDDELFYTVRGIKVHSLEVTRYQCADTRTSEVLEQVIQETTNRMNRLSQAESENEVSLFKTQGQIAQFKLHSELLATQHLQTEQEAIVAGNAEANRIAAFLASLEPKMPDLEKRIEMWQTLRKTDALSVVAQGGATLYYTPKDVDLSIEARNTTTSRS